MFLKRNTFTILIVSLILVFNISELCYAQENIDSIKSSAQESLKNFTQQINSDKSHFNISQNEDAANMKLNNAYEYSKININSIKDQKSLNNNKNSNNILSKENNKYLFSVQLGNRQIATAYVAYYKNKWQVVRLSSDYSLDQDIQQGEINASIPKDSINLINDESLNIIAISDKSNSNQLIPLRDNNLLNLKKGVKTNVTNLSSTINKKVLNNAPANKTEKRGASLSTSNTTNSSKYILIPLALIIIILSIFLYKFRIYKKKLH